MVVFFKEELGKGVFKADGGRGRAETGFNTGLGGAA